ncbi:MAG: hypothetical protein ACQEWV_32695 [Bacillota bacterium]
MNKKWFLMLTSLFLSAMMLVGCNIDPDPAPPEEKQNIDQNQVEEDLNDTNNLNGDTEPENEMPGDDENDTIK